MAARMQFGPDDEDAFHARRRELEQGFGDWVAQFQLQVDSCDFGLLLDWKWGYGDGHLGRWRTQDLTEFLLGWCPRKVMVAEDELLASIPAAAGLGMSYLATLDLLDPAGDSVDTLVEHALALTDEFKAAMSDTSSFGLGKSLMSTMGADDLAGVDEDGLQQLVDEFNALPFDERRAITDPAIANRREGVPDVPSFGPVRLSTDDELRETAATGPILTKLAGLADYFAAPGKPLTKNGNLKIADARALSELLGTDDVYEEQIGDTTFRKRSSTQFVQLDLWQWLARESGAIRLRNNRLVGVKAWQERRRKDSLAEVARAFEVLVTFGPLNAYDTTGDDASDLLDDSTPALLGRLLGAGDDFEELLSAFEAVADTTGVKPRFAYDFRSSLDRFLGLLDLVGVVEQSGVRYEPRTYFGSDRYGGLVALTPLGRYLAVQAVRKAGYDVEVLPPTEEMGFGELASLRERLDPRQWWDEVLRWVEAAGDDAAFARLAVALTEDDATAVTTSLASAPDDHVDRLVPLLQPLVRTEDPALRDASAAAISWLDAQGRLEPGSCSEERIRDAHLDTWIAVANTGDAADTIEAIREGASFADQTALVHAVANRRSPGATRLLDTIGHDHPDRTVAKAARKELFRLRSRSPRAR